MATERLNRINELAKKAKEVGLTAEEKQEQARLREEYLAAFRANVIQQLDNTFIVDAEGNERPLPKKGE